MGVATSAAMAMTAPAPIKINGGPLGTLEVSGGLDGYFYALSGAGNATNPGLLGTDKSTGGEVYTGEIKIVKPDGLVQFTIDLYPTNYLPLGHAPTAPSTNTFTLGPLYAAYVTLAPTPNFTISAGQLYTVEGYEGVDDWLNANITESALFWVEYSSGRGVQATYTHGPVSATLEFGDGPDTGVFNTFQSLVTYTFNKNNALTLYGVTNVGRTEPNTFAYGNGTTGSGYGASAPYVNSTMIGAYYDFTYGNLNLVPEAQYVYAKVDHKIGINKFTSNFGVEVIGDYQFGKSPWSLGSMVEYYRNNGPYGWYLNPHSAGLGIALTPTWQRGNIFVRGEVSLLHLTAIGTGSAFGSSGTDRNQAMGLLEAGLMF